MTADLSAVRGFAAVVVVLALVGGAAVLVLVGRVGAAALVGGFALVAFAVAFDAMLPPERRERTQPNSEHVDALPQPTDQEAGR